ncbi:MAG TPA: hypothetical protein VJO33_19630, partial [Gemmatimonadaceae bacterium]|nr:hypothetical protein [Gemmatimonadaceae bacterium]
MSMPRFGLAFPAIMVAIVIAFAPSGAKAQKGKRPTNPPGGDSVKAQLCQPNDPSCFTVPVVTPDGTPVTVNPGSNSYVFTVKNTGHFGTIGLTAICSSGGVVTGCSPSQPSVSLATNASTPITVSYTGASGGGTGTVTLHGQANSGTNTDDGWINVTVNAPPSYTVAVTPDGASIGIEPGTSLSYGFKVRNTGNQTTTYNLTPSCSGVVTNCSVAGSVTLAHGDSATVPVSYNAVTRGSSGTLGLTAAYSGNGAINDAGSVSISVNNSYGVAVGPDPGSQVITPGTTTAPVIFTVQNTGSTQITYSLSGTCGTMFGTSGCTPPPSVTVGPNNATANVEVDVDVATYGSSFSVRLTATDPTHGPSDMGTVNVSTGTYTVRVTPHPGDLQTQAEANTNGNTFNFNVYNAGTLPAIYSLSTSCSTSILNGGAGLDGCSGPSTVSLGVGASQLITVTYNSHQPRDSGKVRLSASAPSTFDQGELAVVILDRAVAVTPKDSNVTVDPGANSQLFRIVNNGNIFTTYTLTAPPCGGAMTGCSVSPTSIGLAAGASGTATVSYTAPTAGSTGSASLRATYGSFTDLGSINVTARLYAVAVTPDGAAERREPGLTASTKVFTIQNTGNQTDSYNLSVNCTGTLTGCTISRNPLTSRPAGSSDTVTVRFNTGAAGTTGTATLTATSQAKPTVSDPGSLNVTVNSYTVAVTPKGTTVNVDAGADTTQAFRVKNMGNASAVYSLVPNCTGATAGCTAPSSVTVAAGDSATVNVTYHRTTPGSSGTIQLTASYGSGAAFTSDAGTVTISVSSYTVAVTPDNLAISVASGANSQLFKVQNTGNRLTTYNLTRSCTGAATSCSVSPTSIQLAAGDSANGTVSYSLPSGGSTGTVTLTATYTGNSAINDAGSIIPTAYLVAAAQIALPDPKARAVIERDLCLTASAGKGAAYECGDLRLAHALPTTRTFNRPHAPTLLYNSQHAKPYALVAVDVTVPSSASTPNQILGTLTRVGNGTADATATWAGNNWTPGATRRVVLGFDASALSTGIYPYTVTITTVYGTQRQDATASGNLVIVNRKSSPFGSGWWLAGYETLYPVSGGGFLWVGGDGSTRRYDPVSGQTGVWAAESVDRPDTLKQETGYTGSSAYVRYLPHGVRVQFDLFGRHIATVDRLHHVTVFDHADPEGSVTDTLRVIHLAVPNGAGDRSYVFNYVSGLLQTVAAPPVDNQARTTTLTDSAGVVTVIQDPDLHTVRFGYATGQLDSRTD